MDPSVCLSQPSGIALGSGKVGPKRQRQAPSGFQQLSKCLPREQKKCISFQGLGLRAIPKVPELLDSLLGPKALPATSAENPNHLSGNSVIVVRAPNHHPGISGERMYQQTTDGMNCLWVNAALQINRQKQHGVKR